MPQPHKPTVIAITCHRKRLNGPTLGMFYSHALLRLGALPLMLYELPEGGADWVAEHAGGLLLSGGVDSDPAMYGQSAHPKTDIDPLRDRAEFALLRAFERAGKPVMGICRGIQAINVYAGGTLHQHLPDLKGVVYDHSDENATHGVRAARGSFLSDLFGDAFSVNSTHHQAIDRVAEGFTVRARSDEPAAIVEAIERDNWFAVQWHPERMGETMRPLFERFVGMCGRA